MKTTLRQFFSAQLDALYDAEQKAHRAQIEYEIQRKTAKRPETIRKYEYQAQLAQAEHIQAQEDYSTFLQSDEYLFFERADKLARKAVKRLATGEGAGADLARKIQFKYGFNHDIFDHAVLSLAGEIWLCSEQFTTVIDNDNAEKAEKQKIDISWLGITFTDYIYAPKKVKGGQEVYRWYSPTKNYLCGFVNKFIRHSGNSIAASGDVGEQTADEIILQTPELTNAIEKLTDKIAFQGFKQTLRDDSRKIIELYEMGYNFTEIADILKVTKQAIGQRWTRIAELYRKFLNTAYISA